MITVNIHEAKTQPSRLIARVAAGEEVIIARAGEPVARLSLYHRPENKRGLGRDAGLFELPDDFDEPLPEEVLATFER